MKQTQSNMLDVDLALSELRNEIQRARSKHPGNRLMVEALVEELGEFSENVLSQMHKNENGVVEKGNKECLHIATVILRILLEGTECVEYLFGYGETERFLHHMASEGEVAKKTLQKHGVPD